MFRRRPPVRSGTAGTVRRAAVAATAALAAVAAMSGPAGAAPAAAASADPVPTLVVATNGSDTAPGSLDRPLRTIQRAVDLAEPGDVIAVRGGTYPLTSANISITTSGRADAPITLTNYGDERVVIDGEALPASHTPVGGSIPRPQRGAIHQEASWWRVSGLEIINGPYGVYCDGCNDNVFADLVTRDNYESGFQLQGQSPRNLILNLDSYGNRDPRKNGESADGLAIKEGSGGGNVVRGARLWNNVDDGFDAWEFGSPITVEDSVAYGNGYNRWNLPDFSGDGNGFKLGGGSPAPVVAHVVRNTMSFGNAADGYTDNGNGAAMRLTRNTAYENADRGFQLNRSATVPTGNLAVGNGAAVAIGSARGSGNSWGISGSWSDADLLSTDSRVLTGPRTGAGDIAGSDFLRPRNHPDLGARL
ncbi:right-handed parallel beta-helix repeat-containing protein [Marinitenerispora sediminis]|uniref:Pectate lyase n=1 Tax=Marinitenerispora sediminis TaxID=1931232 RepID=A0A368T035_9ACTN|nr:right-handed parallel beta-helix repeat-containing protein [Marinitenerispora sediminis]RCV48180.1 pectate lyase [Marinitenerispora sediminis]RCV49356.1 pectate lyase [Marinitenerispora sediminis]RCV51946.1 pectate lyase [Marinitenerispora sediminis]